MLVTVGGMQTVANPPPIVCFANSASGGLAPLRVPLAESVPGSERVNGRSKLRHSRTQLEFTLTRSATARADSRTLTADRELPQQAAALQDATEFHASTACKCPS